MGDGQALLGEAMRADLSDGARLRELERLRRRATPEQATAAYEIALLRRRAAEKFTDAGRLYFSREALEQASSEVVACHRAARYQRLFKQNPDSVVADLACGVGGDMLALARVAKVIAIDRDPVRLAMATANAAASGLADRVRVIQADLEHDAIPHADAIFFDPARRVNGRRVFSLADYQPPISMIERWRKDVPAIGVKVAPGVDDTELESLGDLEAEFISVGGELKEAMLWFGPLAPQPGRRAIVLANGTIASMFIPKEAQTPVVPLAEPASYLIEPDPAVIRAHLVAWLAAESGAVQLDREIAYLTAMKPLVSPLARSWRVIEWLPFALKRLRVRLRALDAGAVTVKKRGSPLDTTTLARQLSGSGSRPLVVVLTWITGRPAAIICEGPVIGE